MERINMSRALRPNWKDPLTYGVIIAALILILLGLTACSSRPKPPKADSPKAGVANPPAITRVSVEHPKTSKEGAAREDDLRAEIEILQRELDRAEADTARLKKREAQARWEAMARMIQIFAAIAMLGGVALTVLGFFNPALKPLRLMAGLGAGAALVVFGLAGYLPVAAPWLGPISIFLTLSGAAWMLWKLNLFGSAAVGAIAVGEELKSLATIPAQERRRIQSTAAGKRSSAINEIRKAMGQ